MTRQIHQSMLRSFRRSTKFKYGYEVPNDYNDVLRIDKANGNTKWADAHKLELSQLDDYTVFVDHGKAILNGRKVLNAPEGYLRIRVRCVYDVKHDGHHKARIVTGGHLTPVPVENVYSGVVYIRSIRLVIFLAELNKLDVWGADIGNAYLEAKTKEKVYIVAGPEFGEREGHILVIHKALYGLRTSGKRWRERFSDDLMQLGFYRSKADPDVWMRHNKKLDIYEYIATYVDDLLLAMEDPASIIALLKSKFKYKIKGDGPLDYHLGTSYERDKDGRLIYHTKKYIERLASMYEKMFGCAPKQSHKTPLEKNDHPEMDETPFLNE